MALKKEGLDMAYGWAGRDGESPAELRASPHGCLSLLTCLGNGEGCVASMPVDSLVEDPCRILQPENKITSLITDPDYSTCL